MPPDGQRRIATAASSAAAAPIIQVYAFGVILQQ
jgi:hypothetical protein